MSSNLGADFKIGTEVFERSVSLDKIKTLEFHVTVYDLTNGTYPSGNHPIAVDYPSVKIKP